MAAQLGSPMTTDDMKVYFKKFDKNGDGYITADEMRIVISTYHGSNLTPEQFEKEVKNMIKTADINGDGKISFEGIVHVLNSLILLPSWRFITIVVIRAKG